MTFLTQSSSEKQLYEKSNKIKIIKDAFLHVNESRIHKNELIVFCPKHYHHKPKLEINIENNIFHCWVCNYRGLVPKLLKELSRIDSATLWMSMMGIHRAKEQSATESILAPPAGVYGAALSTSQIYTIFQKTGIGKYNIIKGNIGISTDEKYKNRIIFPSFNENGKVNYFTARAIYDEKIKYLSCEKSSKSIIFNEIFIDWSKPIILTESCKTHFKMIDHPNFVPLLGSSLKFDCKLVNDIVLNGTREIILMLDRDAVKKQLAIAQGLLRLGLEVKVVQLPYGVNQPDELDEEIILDCVKNAEEISSGANLLKMKIASKILF